MIQTSYVPLEHPYQIIEYNGTMGIQIGTLIVTRDLSEEKGEYAIETHSHPVVSYVNNRIHPDLKHPRTISLPKPFEGVVWNHVELNQVSTVAREDETLSWIDFMDYCKKLMMYDLDIHYQDINFMIFESYATLMDWGIDIDEPKMSRRGDRILKVELDYTFEHNGTTYCVTNGDLGIIAGLIDEDVTVENIVIQVQKYLEFMSHFGINNCKVKFWTQNLFLQGLANKLKTREHILRSNASQYLLSDDDDWESIGMAAEPEPEER